MRRRAEDDEREDHSVDPVSVAIEERVVRTWVGFERLRHRAFVTVVRFAAWARHGSGESLRSRMSVALWAAGAGVVLMTAGWLTVIPLSPATPEEVVRDYLEAVRDKDVKRSLEIAGADESDTAGSPLLTADALSSGWRIDSVVEISPASGAQPAEVLAFISDKHGDNTSGTFTVQDTDDGWRIQNPFADVNAADQTAVSYLDLNGVTAPLPDADDGGARVFPGSYRLYSGNRSLLSADNERVLV
ncbi:MAG: hypothetical protein ACRD0P_35220, partial [Stackebrandtia sp.]